MEEFQQPFIFDNREHKVVVLVKDGTPLFRASDIETILDIEDMSKADSNVAVVYPYGGIDTSFLTEQGMDKLLASTQKPAAEPLRNWASNIIPEICAHLMAEHREQQKNDAVPTVPTVLQNVEVATATEDAAKATEDEVYEGDDAAEEDLLQPGQDMQSLIGLTPLPTQPSQKDIEDLNANIKQLTQMLGTVANVLSAQGNRVLPVATAPAPNEADRGGASKAKVKTPIKKRPRPRVKGTEACEKCGKKITKYATSCADCAKQARPTKFNVTKEELHDMVNVQELAYTTIGAHFGVSDNAIRKRCLALGVTVRKVHKKERAKKSKSPEKK